MDNFLTFIDDDIQNKKTLLGAMPTTTKSNIKKFNEKVDTITKVYQEYYDGIKRYVKAKGKSFEIASEKEVIDVSDDIKKLEQVRFLLNPFNTYFEKIGMDTLLYQIGNYHDFKFSSLNGIINDFLDRFALAGIDLTLDDFNQTSYVKEFMNSFLSVRNLKSNNYDTVAEMFEKIYWVNPEIVHHLELNFRRLIKKHMKRLTGYIEERKVAIGLGVDINYDSCLERLQKLYRELRWQQQEDISIIIEKAKTRVIDITTYASDAKMRLTTFDSLMVEPIHQNNEVVMRKFYEDVEKLKQNIEEYRQYLKFVPLINGFKSEYLKSSDLEASQSIFSRDLKAIEKQISDEEAKLDKINKKIFSPRRSLFAKKESSIKSLKFEAVKQANVLYELYHNHDQGFFNNKVGTLIKETFTVADLLNLYYSYDMFKKAALKKAYNISDYEEIKKLSDEFDAFAINPGNVVINGISLYEESNVAKTIVDKYRMVNINITEEDLTEEALDLFLDKINFVLRVQIIESSTTTVDKIWFMTEATRIDSINK